MPGYARRHASASCAEMAEPIEMRLGCGLEWAEESMLRGAQWRNLANMIEPFVCGGDAALCQITLTTCCYYDHWRTKAHRVSCQYIYRKLEQCL